MKDMIANSKRLLISIIIPTCNVEATIGFVLHKILDQQKVIETLKNILQLEIEVIVIDSESTDNTTRIIERFIKKYPNKIKLYKIPNRLFHHSITRNYGVKKSSGSIIVFLNGDAVPLDRSWLINLVKPILTKDVVATFSRQIPWSKTRFAEKIFILNTYPKDSFLISKNTYMHFFKKHHVLFSTVSCAIKRDIFEKLDGFDKNINSGEDQEFALRLIENNKKIFYSSKSVVLHSHNMNFITVARRYIQFGRSFKYLKKKFDDVLKLDSAQYVINGYKKIIKITINLLDYSSDNYIIVEFIYTLFYMLTKTLSYIVGRFFGTMTFKR